jgi:hypothetical protein
MLSYFVEVNINIIVPYSKVTPSLQAVVDIYSGYSSLKSRPGSFLSCLRVFTLFLSPPQQYLSTISVTSYPNFNVLDNASVEG